MDHIDREILQILQHNARASLKMIAEKTFLSSPAAKGRAAGKWQQKSPAHRTREDGPVSPLPGSGLPPVLILINFYMNPGAVRLIHRKKRPESAL